MSLGPAASFLSEVIEPPPHKAVTASLAALADVGAINLGAATGSNLGPAQQSEAGGPDVTSGAAVVAGGGAGWAPSAAAGGAGGGGGAEVEQAESLTPLGRHLALLPLEPRLGKLLVMGACLGCLAPALTIAAALSYKSPFVAPLERMDEMETAKRALAAPTTVTNASSSDSSASGGGKGRPGKGKGGGQPPGQIPGQTPGQSRGGGAANIAAGQQSDHFVLVAAFEMWRHARSKGAGEAAKVRLWIS
jgi:HrpA-like RNA helicase